MYKFISSQNKDHEKEMIYKLAELQVDLIDQSVCKKTSTIVLILMCPKVNKVYSNHRVKNNIKPLP